MQGKILVIRGGAIGDFILTLPVLAALRRQFPDARIEVLGYSHIAQLAVAGRLADDVRSIEAGPLAGFFARHGPLNAALQEYFASFAIIVSYLYDPDQIFQSNVARCSKAQFIAGPHRPDESQGRHATQVFLQPLQRLAIFEPDPVPRLRMPQLLGVSAALPILALHPGSGSERKNWPEAKWAELLRHLVDSRTAQLLVVSGEAEEERLPRLTKALPSSAIQFARNLPLPALADRLASCTVFLGHDSGITHLAAAVGLPVAVLWGDSAEAVWRPQAEKVSLLRDPGGLSAIEVSSVLHELSVLMA